MIPVGWEAVYYSRVYAGLISTLFALSLPIVAARLYTRYHSAIRLSLDDWIVGVAFVSNIPSSTANVPTRTGVLI